MSTLTLESEIQIWLKDLTSADSKLHERVASTIAKTPVLDQRIVIELEKIALDDAYGGARGSAKNALEKIAEAHFAAGNDIRAYLEKLRTGALAPKAAAAVQTRRVEPTSSASPTPVSKTPQATEAIAAGAEPEAVIATEKTAPVAAASAAEKAAPKPPPSPALPFDQWLLSERNIKLALYSGGFLLLLAGLIFVGVRWAYLPGIAKLGVTLAVTLAMYAGGVILFRRPSLKVGGTALLAIASGFLPLNFVVTHLYLTNVSVETTWFVASLVCATVYCVTAVWSRQNLFTAFTIVAMYSSATAGMTVLAFVLSTYPLGYAFLTLGLLIAAYGAHARARFQFMSRALRIGAHAAAPVVFLLAALVWIMTFSVTTSEGNPWTATAAVLLIGGFYVVEDWRMHLAYARWWAAVIFGVAATFLCTQLHLTSILTGLALMVVGAAYLVLGKFLQRGKKLSAGMPLYTVSALLASFVTLQAAVVYLETPEHLALALVGDVALLALAATLFHRVEFAFGAAWLLLAPVYIYGNVYLDSLSSRGLLFGLALLVYTAIGFRLAPRNINWAMPFLSVAAFLSVVVPVMLYQNYLWMTASLIAIAVLYAAMAVRLQLRWLVLPAVAAVNCALVSGTLIFMPLDWNAARAMAFAFCGWGVALRLSARGVRYIRLHEWAQPIAIGALANFGLTYLLVAFLAQYDYLQFGFVSQALGLTLAWGVALLALTAYLYRRAEFVYAAAWMFIAPTYIFASLSLGDQTLVGLVLGALMLAYTAAGYFVGHARLKWGGAFLTGAAILSVLSVYVLAPNFAAMTAMLLGIAALYAFCAVWLRWHWLTLAALAALNAAALTGARMVFTTPLEIRQVLAIECGALGTALIAGGVELKRRGWLVWRLPLYIAGVCDLVISLLLAQANSEPLTAVISAVIAVVCFAMQWAEREELARLKIPPFLSYIGALMVMNAVFFGTQALNVEQAFVPAVMAGSGAVIIGAALKLRRGGGEKLYGEPLRYVGLLFTAGALAAAVLLSSPVGGAIAFSIAAVAFGADGWLRKQIGLVYAGGAALVAALWWMLRFYQVAEWQAFAIPLGALCLVIGWSEAQRGRMMWFQLATIAGLLVLMVSAFYQSLENVSYAVLLFIEGVAAFGIGMKMRSRIYVEAGIAALLANGLAQFGPAFINLERWIQIGTIGIVLLIGGLAALFRRQRLLEMRRALTSEWKLWKP